VKIIDDFINRLQLDWRLVALTEIGVIITAYPSEAGDARLNLLPILSRSPTGRNEYHRWGAHRVSITIDGQSPAANADHSLFPECHD
jgi:hypothetical protein